MKYLLLLALLLFIPGCMTFDSEEEEEGALLKPRVPASKLENYLRLGRSKAGDVWEFAGQPENRQPVKGQEIWTYVWEHTEERTAYSGTRIGEERLIALENYGGFRHTLRRKTRATLVFDADGILRDYRFVRE